MREFQFLLTLQKRCNVAWKALQEEYNSPGRSAVVRAYIANKIDRTDTNIAWIHTRLGAVEDAKDLQ